MLLGKQSIKRIVCEHLDDIEVEENNSIVDADKRDYCYDWYYSSGISKNFIFQTFFCKLLPISPYTLTLYARKYTTYTFCLRSTGNDDIYFIKSSDGGASFGKIANLSNDSGDSYEPHIALAGNKVYQKPEVAPTPLYFLRIF
ncbi:MAG: hypothetical protein WB988_05750 [Candidatus Nitrosopolaris sp.]